MKRFAYFSLAVLALTSIAAISASPHIHKNIHNDYIVGLLLPTCLVYLFASLIGDSYKKEVPRHLEKPKLHTYP